MPTCLHRIVISVLDRADVCQQHRGKLFYLFPDQATQTADKTHIGVFIGVYTHAFSPLGPRNKSSPSFESRTLIPKEDCRCCFVGAGLERGGESSRKLFAISSLGRASLRKKRTTAIAD